MRRGLVSRAAFGALDFLDDAVILMLNQKTRRELKSNSNGNPN